MKLVCGATHCPLRGSLATQRDVEADEKGTRM